MTRTLILTAVAIVTLSALSLKAIDIDGINITGDFANATHTAFQDTPPNWGDNRFLASMYAMTNSDALLLGVGMELHHETVTLFFDIDPDTGSNVYPVFNGEIDGEARAQFIGMTFDTNFTPDKAITFTRWQAGEPDEGCHVGWHDIVREISTSWGKFEDTASPYVFTNQNVIFGFFPANDVGQTNWVHEWNLGCELSIPFDWLGATTNEVKIMAQIGSWAGDFVANQTLPPVHNDPSTTNSLTADRRYDLIPGAQYLTVPVMQTATGGALFATAEQSQTRLFAVSSVNEMNIDVVGGVPPFAFRWELGDGFVTNVEEFSYRYPADGLFSTMAIISDDSGQVITSSLADVTVMPETTVDGLDIQSDFAGVGTSVVQDTASNWGEATVPGTGAELDRLHAYTDISDVYIGVCGNMITGMGDHVLAVFIDVSSQVGSNVMPSVASGSPAKLENLAGMSFDAAFSPDKVLLFSINQWYDYWADYYEIDQNTNTWWGDKTEWHSIFDPFQRSFHLMGSDLTGIAAFNNNSTVDDPAAATNGFEGMLSYGEVYNGIPLGQQEGTIRLQALLFNFETGILANQSLPGINGNSSGFGQASTVDFSAVPGNQYIEIPAPIIPEPALAGIGLALAGLALRRRA